MFGSGYIDENPTYLRGEPFEVSGYGNRVDYTKRNGDQIVIRKQLDLSKFVRSWEELNILNTLLKNSPQVMDPPASNHSFKRESGSILPVNAEKSSFFNYNRLDLELMRNQMNNANLRLTQDDVDLFLSMLMQLIEQADRTMVTHPTIRLKDFFIDDPHFKLLSPLSSDAFMLEYCQKIVQHIQASGQNWTPSCYTIKDVRNKVAEHDSNGKAALQNHGLWICQMIKRSFLSALSLATAIDDRVFYDAQGNLIRSNIDGALQVVYH